MNKWEDYGLIIEKEIFEKIKQFEPINANGSKNNKGFRITKNGRNTGPKPIKNTPKTIAIIDQKTKSPPFKLRLIYKSF